MKKEMFIAIFIGLTLGLIITYGVYRMRVAFLRGSDNVTTSTTPDPSPTPDTTSLTIFSPEDGSIQTQKELTVSGTTLPNAYLVLFVNNEDYISTADQSGNFSFNVILEDGGNILKIHTIDGNGTTTTVQRTVIVQSTATPAATASAKPSPSIKPSASVRPTTSVRPSPSVAP